MISFCVSMLLAVLSCFLGGEGGGGGGGGCVPSSSSVVDSFDGGDGSTANGGDDRRDLLCFRQVFNSVYSSLFFISIVRLIAWTTVLSMVCVLYLHHANIAVHECCNSFSSTKDIYSNLSLSENCSKL